MNCPHTGTTHEYVNVRAFLKDLGFSLLEKEANRVADNYQIELECQLCGATATFNKLVNRTQWVMPILEGGGE